MSVSVTNTANALRITKAMQSMYNCPEHSDFRIICQDRTFHAHKAIIACQGGFFKAVMQHGFKEAETDTIDLSKDDQEMVEAVLCFLYGLPLPFPPDDYAAKAVYLARVYATADFYQMYDLKEDIKIQFVIFSAQDDLFEAKAIFQAGHQIYTSTPESDRGLRNVLVRKVSPFLREVLHENKANQAILKSVPGLGHDLVLAKAAVPIRRTTNLRCRRPGCNMEFTVYEGHSVTLENLPQYTCPACRYKSRW